MKAHRGTKLGLLLSIAVALSALSVPLAAPSAAADVPDQVLAWNQHAYDELIVFLPPPNNSPAVAGLHMAMVHGAIYDAVNAIAGGYQPYLGAPAMADPSDSEDSAAAAAGYGVLLTLVPAERADELKAYYDASISAILAAGVPPASVDGGVAVGEAAARRMIEARTGDGRYGDPTWPVGYDPGEWRPLADGLAGSNFYWIGKVKPFLVPNAVMFATDGPLDLSSSAYATEFDQVKSLGAANSTTRTADQTAQALFWADHAVAMWDRIFRQLSQDQHLSTAENARFFAMMFLTSADAIIACQQDKARWLFWRPQTAIREAATDGNPATVADPTWTSLLGNPPYPDHPSGHNCASSAIVHTLRDFFGTDRMSFSATRAVSPIGPITRSYSRFSQALDEIRLARVYGGIHFMTADAAGASLGRKVAKWREGHALQPVA
jgi:hypothetical protein